LQRFPETWKLFQGFLQGKKIEKGWLRLFRLWSRFSTRDQDVFVWPTYIFLGAALLASMIRNSSMISKKSLVNVVISWQCLLLRQTVQPNGDCQETRFVSLMSTWSYAANHGNRN
jgi:hypothetical protein